MKPLDSASQEELAKTVARLAEAHASHRDAFVKQPGKTIDARKAGAFRVEPRSGLELGATLGEGGMGVVRQARQLALDRDVAVKTIQPKLASELATRMLLQEALILGRLEHPNILPIHDIRYEHGEPHVVLKKIEGIEWSSVMHRPAVIRDELGGDDALGWNLGILIQVCNAVHFAHSRGIIHRDLKPENVMIGEFGEVYVMDWGLALCLEDDGTGRFPLARDATQLAGTPQYMAPEMLGGGEHLISERTDVYLLGAILYEIITGRAPHRGSNMAEIVTHVIVSRPQLPESCPSELARICSMAMDPDPGWRFEDAEALRLALQRFVQHRAVHAMVEYELQQNNPRGASRLLTATESVDPALRARVEEAMRAQVQTEQRMTELESLSKQLDIETGGTNRAVGAGILGVVWTIAPVLAPRVMGPSPNRWPVIAFLLAVLIGLALWAYLAHQEIKQSSKTRWLMRGAAVAMVGTLLMELAGSLLHLTPQAIEALWPLVWFCVSAMLTVQVDWRMLPMTLGFLGTLIVACFAPELRHYAMGASNLIMTVNMFSIWLPWRDVLKQAR